MPIPETQLSVWSNQGAETSSQTTYNSIQSCIKGHNWNDDVQYEIYLQGSYKNSTNIYGNSDVDIVVEFTSIFYSNKDTFNTEQLKEFNEYFNDGKYTLQSFKDALISRLRSYYGSENVDVGNKAIRVKGQNGRLDADVIVCAQYRKFNDFSKQNPYNYVQGIIFWESTSRKEVINFPNQHFRNGASKNSEGNMNFKPTVRILKNMKAKLVKEDQGVKNIAPSYFVECLAYNVPTAKFLGESHHNRVLGVLGHWHTLAKDQSLMSLLVTQNEQSGLFGSSDQQWNQADANIFINKMIKLWNAG